MVSICLLGDLQVRDGDAAVALPPSRKTRLLLAYLAATARPHRRERLCELFWDLPDDPRGALRWSLSKLRAILDRDGAPVVDADRNEVSLKLEPAQVDLFAVRAALRDGVEGAATQILESLAKRFRGPFLADLDPTGCPELDSWLAGMREETRRLHADILYILDDRHAAEPERALPYLRELVQLDPWAEPAWARLVQRLNAAGRRQEAEAQYAAAAKALAEVGGPTRLLERARQSEAAPAAPTRPPPPDMRQEIRFCRAADGVRIAYALAGEGPPLVKTANWMNHLEYDWESPIFADFLRGLADGRRLLRYDARGNGLSDWDVDEVGFDAWYADFEAVIEASGFERFPILGVSQGAASAIAYAARHPERVSHLVLLGAFAAGRRDPEGVAQRQAMATLIRTGWAQENPAFRQLFATLFIPGATRELAEAFTEQQRRTTSAECAARYYDAASQLDVRDLLAKVSAPTLVLHSRGDAVVPIEAGRLIASSIPNARFVALPGQNHMLLEDEPAMARFFEELRDFLAT
ncbi:alpha/beta fold hydrolase [Phenylobacterium sp.]|uniref:alpha/beta fold hydrolase n=1 Tax=Phenylobacterium sp. TaxID=1871053 RepID=UPI002EDB99C4